MTPTSTGDNSLRSAVGGGVAAGAAAYVFGYLLTYVTHRNEVDEQLAGFNVIADLLGGDPIPAWQGVGWLFYNAHFVATEIPSLVGTGRSVNFIAEADGGSLALLYVVPPLFLLVAGVAVGRLASASTPLDGAMSGSFVLAGYLPLAVGGAFVFRYAVGDGSVAPDRITVVLLAGLVYPVVFGGAGGALAGLLAGRDA